MVMARPSAAALAVLAAEGRVSRGSVTGPSAVAATAMVASAAVAAAAAAAAVRSALEAARFAGLIASVAALSVAAAAVDAAVVATGGASPAPDAAPRRRRRRRRGSCSASRSASSGCTAASGTSSADPARGAGAPFPRHLPRQVPVWQAAPPGTDVAQLSAPWHGKGRDARLLPYPGAAGGTVAQQCGARGGAAPGRLSPPALRADDADVAALLLDAAPAMLTDGGPGGRRLDCALRLAPASWSVADVPLQAKELMFEAVCPVTQEFFIGDDSSTSGLGLGSSSASSSSASVQHPFEDGVDMPFVPERPTVQSVRDCGEVQPLGPVGYSVVSDHGQWLLALVAAGGDGDTDQVLSPVPQGAEDVAAAPLNAVSWVRGLPLLYRLGPTAVSLAVAPGELICAVHGPSSSAVPQLAPAYDAAVPLVISGPALADDTAGPGPALSSIILNLDGHLRW